MIRIIDNKKIDLTNDEWAMYQKICKSYDIERRGILGKDLFTDLFATDKNGIILFLKPPTKLTSMEVYMFLVSTMIHQHLGIACTHVDNLVVQLDSKMAQLDKMLERTDEILKEFDSRREQS